MRRGVRGAARCLSDGVKPGRATRARALTELGTSFRRAFRSLRSLRGRDTHRGGEIGHAQFELLVELCERGPLPAGELAEAVGGERRHRLRRCSTTSATAELGRAQSARSPTAGVVVVKLTRRGERKVEARRALWRRRWEEALEGVEDEELRIASRVLERIGAIFTEHPKD